MVTGKTKNFVSLLESSKKMHKNTVKQLKSKGKKLPVEVKDIYGKKLCEVNNSKTSQNFEPKTNNRWYLKFPEKVNIPKWYIKGLTRPTYPFNIGGKITVVLRDGIEPSITKNLIKLIEEQKPFKIKVQLLDALGEVIEKWILNGCIITSIQWSPLDYENNDISTIYVDISYNKVKFKDK